MAGYSIALWHNVELPEVRSSRVDMLGETLGGELVHIELQSTNDPGMAMRMAEYALAILRRFRRMPVQLVLYVGQQPLRMEMRLAGPHLAFDCRVIDIRDLDGPRWLASARLEDNIVAVLIRFENQLTAIRNILDRIAMAEPKDRPAAMANLLLLAGLRKTGDTIRHEANQMPLLNDIMDHEVFGPMIRQSMEIGRNEGLSQGLSQSRLIVLIQIAGRFGPVPDWAGKRIEAMQSADLQHLALRLLDAGSLEDLLG